MQRPRYYNEFLKKVNGEQNDDMTFFMDYLLSFNESDWQDFLSDLFGESPYPALIQRVRKDYSTIAYYTLFFKHLPEETRVTQDRVINNLFTQQIENYKAASIEGFLGNISTFCRLMERGVKSKSLIDKVILNDSFSENLRLETAITLVFYKDIVTLNFWKFKCEELLKKAGFEFLSFPRFCFLSKIEPLDAFQSLQHFKLGHYLNEAEILLPVEDFFLKYIDVKTSKEELRMIFEKFDKKLKKFLQEKVLVSNKLIEFRELFDTPVQLDPLVNLSEVYDDFKTLNSEIMDVRVRSLDDSSHIRLLKSIEGKIDPYNAFTSEEISAIDRGFIPKTSIFNHINKGIKYFKESRFQDALENYEKALEIIRETKEKDNLTVYFYSWMLHEVGNICFVNNRLDLAKNYYTNSYFIKSGIEEIPKTFLFATQLKIFAIYLEVEYMDPEVVQNFGIFISKLKKYRKTSPRNTHYFIDCLLGDSLYYMSKAHYYNNNEKAFDRYFSSSMKYAEDNDDFAGKLKLYALHSLAKDSEKHFGDITTLLTETGKRKLRNPYLGSLVNVALPKESLLSEMGTKLLNLFKRFVITPQVSNEELERIKQAEAVFISKGI